LRISRSSAVVISAVMVPMVPSPKAATGTKVNAMLLGARGGMDVTLPLGAKSAGAAAHLLAAFAASNRAVEATPETLYRRHLALLDATAPGVLHAVHHEAVATHAQARARRPDARGSGTIARVRDHRGRGHGRWRAG